MRGLKGGVRRDGKVEGRVEREQKRMGLSGLYWLAWCVVEAWSLLPNLRDLINFIWRLGFGKLICVAPIAVLFSRPLELNVCSSVVSHPPALNSSYVAADGVSVLLSPSASGHREVF